MGVRRTQQIDTLGPEAIGSLSNNSHENPASDVRVLRAPNKTKENVTLDNSELNGWADNLRGVSLIHCNTNMGGEGSLGYWFHMIWVRLQGTVRRTIHQQQTPAPHRSGANPSLNSTTDLIIDYTCVEVRFCSFPMDSRNGSSCICQTNICKYGGESAI
jgi:hypothetical protein